MIIPCPCKRCRPPGQPFPVAMAIAVKVMRERNFTPERLAEEEAAKKERIKYLRTLDETDE